MSENTRQDNERKRQERLASAYSPEASAEHERIRRQVPENRISPTQRMAMGYQDGARTAAEEIKKEK